MSTPDHCPFCGAGRFWLHQDGVPNWECGTEVSDDGEYVVGDECCRSLQIAELQAACAAREVVSDDIQEDDDEWDYDDFDEEDDPNWEGYEQT